MAISICGPWRHRAGPLSAVVVRCRQEPRRDVRRSSPCGRPDIVDDLAASRRVVRYLRGRGSTDRGAAPSSRRHASTLRRRWLTSSSTIRLSASTTDSRSASTAFAPTAPRGCRCATSRRPASPGRSSRPAPPRRIELEPRWQTTGRMFASARRRAVDRRRVAAAVPAGPGDSAAPDADDARRRSRALAIGFTSALTISMFLPGPPDESLAAVFQSLAAAVLAVSALQNITRPRLALGEAGSRRLRACRSASRSASDTARTLPLAGSHTMLSLLSFGGAHPAWLALAASRRAARPGAGPSVDARSTRAPARAPTRSARRSAGTGR